MKKLAAGVGQTPRTVDSKPRRFPGAPARVFLSMDCARRFREVFRDQDSVLEQIANPSGVKFA
jgi:hypothetical protein